MGTDCVQSRTDVESRGTNMRATGEKGRGSKEQARSILLRLRIHEEIYAIPVLIDQRYGVEYNSGIMLLPLVAHKSNGSI